MKIERNVLLEKFGAMHAKLSQESETIANKVDRKPNDAHILPQALALENLDGQIRNLENVMRVVRSIRTK